MLKWTRRQFGFTALAAAAQPLRGAALSPQSDELLVKAMQALKEDAPKAALSPDRPTYHFHPPANWMNDPNGTLFYKGWYHLFYQLDPYSPRGDVKYWGHARSRDLANWEHLPVALAPSRDKGETQIYSGGAAVGPDGRPRVLYTSVGQRASEQWLAYPVDDSLLRWEKSVRNPVATMAISKPPLYSWRDPFPFHEDGKWYMVCGGNMDAPRGGRGAVHLYEAKNAELTEWKDLGQIFEYKSTKALNCECPNLFRLGEKWVLLVSPWGPVEYFIGVLDVKKATFVVETNGVLDHGASYASNMSRDENGQTILWLWGQMGDPAPEKEKTWNGVLVMPRVITLDAKNVLRQVPPVGFESLRGEPVTHKDLKLTEATQKLKEVSGDCLEIDATFEIGTAKSVVMHVRESEDGTDFVALRYEPERGVLQTGGVTQTIGSFKTLRLRVFLDKRAMEVYAQDGLVAVFTKAQAASTSLQVSVCAKGGTAVLRSATAWTMRPAVMSMEHFV